MMASETPGECRWKPEEAQLRRLPGRNRSEEKTLKSIYLLLGLTIIAATEPIESLQISSIEVPAAVINGSLVNLACNYDLQGDQLYSVKWYKNYVEFFRYQPPASDEPFGSGGAKQEFELNGINLNIAKSNATHVQLSQASLASEGTYKCEVSAESPSFATVSSERQMKIYDNSASATQQEVPDSPPPPPANARPPVYNINDIVNLTCLSGPSRPPAKLVWLLNDRPVSSSSKWLSQQLQASSLTSDGIPLVESRLTLSFRLQPEHLASNTGTTSAGRLLPELLQPRQVQQSLRLRCIAKLALEYSTQTSILVSGGKTSLPKVNKQLARDRPQLPNPSSLVDTSPGQSNVDHQKQQPRRPPGVEVSAYRWPRPAGLGSQMGSQRQNASRRNSLESLGQPDPWPGSSASSGNTQSDYPEMASKSLRYRNWNPRQLRQQADYIDQLLRLLRPNEFESPTIEAKLLEPEVSSFPEDTSASGEPLPMPPGEGDEHEAQIDFNRDYNNQKKPPKSHVGDYQLNDLVKFTCKPRLVWPKEIRPVEPGMELLQSARNSLSSSWLVNGNQVPLNQINAFDGDTNKFYFVQDQYERPHPVAGYSRLPAPPAMLSISNNNTLIGSVSKDRVESDLTGSEVSEYAQTTPMNSNQTGSQTGESSIVIEFTQSLFQAKELELKCRTIVEQPLIEYESQLIALVPTGTQFIQVGNYSGPGNNRNPTRGSSSQRLNNKNALRGRNSSLRPQGSSSSASWRSAPERLSLVALVLAAFLLNLAYQGVPSSN